MDKDFTRSLAVQKAIANEEALLAQAHETLVKAEVAFDIAITKYAALRDMSLGYGDGPWTDEGYSIPTMKALVGPYSLIRMTAAMAIKVVLAQAEKPLTLNQLHAMARAGGWNLGSGGTSLRNLNAALMKMTEIEKMEDGRYRLKESVGVELGDLPF